MRNVYLVICFVLGFFALPNAFALSVDSLYIVGSATPIGWDITKAIKLTKDGSVFTYEGKLFAGEFKFPVNRNSDWNQDMYMRDIENPASAYLHIGGQPDDNKWAITEPGNYTVKIDVDALTIEIIMNFDPSAIPEQLFIVGDATPNGWSIDKATQLTKSGKSFIYNGVLTVGAFKFPVNRNTDWNQTMYMRDTEDDTKFYKHIGGASDDNQWSIDIDGFYRVELNFALSTIKITPIMIYMVGSATSVGWDIANAIQFGQDPDSLHLFTYYGEMFPGEFKFPINQQPDWGQDMYMKNLEDTTKMYYHIGGAPDDNKWVLSETGYYTINVDAKNMTVEILNEAYTGIDAEDQSAQMMLLSNTIADRLTVLNAVSFSYQVYSMAGSLVKRGNSTKGSVNVNDLKSGIYMLRLENQKGSVKAMKFLKK